MCLAMEWQAAPSTNGAAVYKAWRIEDLVAVLEETLGIASLRNGASIRLHTVQCYGLVEENTDVLIPAFNSRPIHPITDDPWKTDAVIGTMILPPRIGYKYPVNVRETPLNWDGTLDTSATFLELKANVKVTVTTYAHIVVDLGQAWTITAKNGGNPQVEEPW